MPSAPVAPSLSLPTRAVLPRPGGGNVPPAPGGPSRDFANVLQAASAEPGGPTQPPDPGDPGPDPLRPPGATDAAIAEPADAAQDPADGIGGQQIAATEQGVLPLRSGSDAPETGAETPLPEAQVNGAQHVTAPEPGDPDNLMAPASPGLAPAPATTAVIIPETAPGSARGIDTSLTRPAAPSETASGPATDPQGPDVHPGGTATTTATAADPRPDAGRILPVLQTPALGLRAQSALMEPEERADRTGPAPRLDAGPGQTQVPGQQAAPLASASGATHPHRAEMRTALLETTPPDPEVTTHHFDLRGAGVTAERPQVQAALLHPDLPRHMAAQLAAAARSGQPDRAVQVLLNPAELGHVRITLHTGDGTINVTVIAERPETLDLMRRHIETLAQEFQRIGYRAAEFSFGNGQSAGSDNTAAGHHTPHGPGGILPDAVVPEATPGRAAQVISDRLDLRL